MEYPYQVVTFFDKEPQIGEFVYQGENGWYPQIALKRRFAFNELSEDEGLREVENFISTVAPFDVHFGKRIQPPHMPVEVIEVIDSTDILRFHRDFIKAMGSVILSKFPEREDNNYSPHMTVTWNGKDVVDTDGFVNKHRRVSKVIVLKDDGAIGDSRAYKAFDLNG